MKTYSSEKNSVTEGREDNEESAAPTCFSSLPLLPSVEIADRVCCLFQRVLLASIRIHLRLIALIAVAGNSSAVAELQPLQPVQRVEIAPRAVESQVPQPTAQNRTLSPQAVSAVDISADGKIITVGTMAFSHDANVWQFSPDGTILAKRHFPPWAPMQVATLAGGKALAAGLAYSRVTSPNPTVWLGSSDDLMAEKLKDEFVDEDWREGQLSRLRPGHGDWRTGWLASSMGELFVRGPDWLFKPPSLLLDSEGKRRRLRYEDKNQLPNSRAMRMVASGDGKRLAFGWLGYSREIFELPTNRDALSVWQVNPNTRLWSAPPSAEAPTALPDPVEDFREMAASFRLAPDVLLPGHVASAVAINRDGSRVASIEYGIWGWVRDKPAIGKWNPPIKVLNFLPRQRGRLRVFDGDGREIYSGSLPAEGMFEIAFAYDSKEIWCWPAAWFARGVAGSVWLPVDSPARTVYRISLEDKRTRALDFPDAVADFCRDPTGERSLVSCWDGRAYLLSRIGELVAKYDLGAPARLAWSSDGAFTIAGTAKGRLIRFDHQPGHSWDKSIPVTEVPTSTRPIAEVVAGLPIYQGGRIPGEHAYVGDIWVIKSGDNAVLIDAGGVSAHANTVARLKSLGIDRVTHVLHTHSHGDHSGGAYLWRAAGAKIVAPKSAELTLTWLMPMLTDYGIYPPRPLDMPLPLVRAGDETDFEVSGLKFRALFVPGHSFDSTIYKIELAGKRIAFTGDLGFENQDILHRCWGDAEKARVLVPAIRDKLLAWQPDIVFTGHGVRLEGTKFTAELLESTEASLKKRESGAR
jgi:glyoxylase-like metal-dependent hydrolase (beta-lactamase superfamily II)